MRAGSFPLEYEAAPTIPVVRPTMKVLIAGVPTQPIIEPAADVVFLLCLQFVKDRLSIYRYIIFGYQEPDAAPRI